MESDHPGTGDNLTGDKLTKENVEASKRPIIERDPGSEDLDPDEALMAKFAKRAEEKEELELRHVKSLPSIERVHVRKPPGSYWEIVCPDESDVSTASSNPTKRFVKEMEGWYRDQMRKFRKFGTPKDRSYVTLDLNYVKVQCNIYII